LTWPNCTRCGFPELRRADMADGWQCNTCRTVRCGITGAVKAANPLHIAQPFVIPRFKVECRGDDMVDTYVQVIAWLDRHRSAARRRRLLTAAAAVACGAIIGTAAYLLSP
jgi:hypothetical protein